MAVIRCAIRFTQERTVLCEDLCPECVDGCTDGGCSLDFEVLERLGDVSLGRRIMGGDHDVIEGNALVDEVFHVLYQCRGLTATGRPPDDVNALLQGGYLALLRRQILP